MFMKKIVSVSTVVLFILLGTMAGDSPLYGDKKNACDEGENLEIHYDFLKGTLKQVSGEKRKKFFTVRHGRDVIFKVINVNRFLYNVTINGEQVNLFATVPSGFGVPAPPDEDKPKEAPPALDVKGEKSALKKKPQARATDEEKKKEEEEEKELKQKIDMLPNAVKDLTGIQKLPSQLEKILYAAKTFPQLEFEKKKLVGAYLRKDVSAMEHEKIIEKVNENCKAKLIKAKKLLGEINKYAGKAVFSLKDFQKISQVRDMIGDIEKNKIIKKTETILSNFKESNFAAYKTVSSVDADEIRFTVEIKPQDEKKTKVPGKLQGPVIVKVKGGWKLDFSTGAIILIDAYDRTYRFDKSPDGEMVTLKKNPDNELKVVLAPLMHIYPRVESGFIGLKNVRWAGFCLGLATGELDKPKIFFGTGLMFGSSTRLTLNVGVALTWFDYLKPGYRDWEDKERKWENQPELTELVKPRADIRLFVSLTYNLGKKKVKE